MNANHDDVPGVVSITRERLRRFPTIYTVTICHDEHGITFTVCDVADTEQDRLAVARDLEVVAPLPVEIHFLPYTELRSPVLRR